MFVVCSVLFGSFFLFGCGSKGAPDSPVAVSPANSTPPETQSWIAQKIKDTGGDYQKLSPEDKQQFDSLGRGHGEMFFNMSKH